MKKLNVFWILVDSARNFQTDVDDRGLPKSVEQFGRNNIFVKNVVTSAPSTFMSISSIMASVPSYLIARNYNNIPDVSDFYPTLPHILKKEGFSIIGSLYYKHGREILSKLFGALPQKYFPKGLSHSKPFWTNIDVLNVFENIIKKNNNYPLFCYLHYNVRVDDNVSNTISNTLKLINTNGFMDNSIIVINSDHGYPLPSRGWDPVIAKKKGLRHDLLLYNDNILTPLALYYPDCPKRILINDFISSLDIVPTIVDILCIDKAETNAFYGKSILPLIHNKEFPKDRVLRTDNRFLGQKDKGTSVIKGSNKLIINRLSDINEESLFNISNDPEELNDLSKKDEYHSIYLSMKSVFEESEKMSLQDNYELLHFKWKTNLHKLGVDVTKTMNIYLCIDDELDYEKIFIKAFTAIFHNAQFNIASRFDREKEKLIEPEKLCDLETYDLVIGSINKEIPWLNKTELCKYRKISSKKYLYADNNGVIFSYWPYSHMMYRYLTRRFKMGIKDPKLLYELIRRILFEKSLGDAMSKADNS